MDTTNKSIGKARPAVTVAGVVAGIRQDNSFAGHLW